MYKILLCDGSLNYLVEKQLISYDVDIAQNSDDIYGLTYENTYDLYVVNVYYYDVFFLLREHGDATPIIFIDELYNSQNLRKSFVIGDDYIVKPLYDEEITTRIEYHYKKLSKHRDNIIKYKDFFYHLQTKQLYKQSEKLKLSPSEIKLVELFLCNKDKALSKLYLFEKLESSSDGSLRVYISKLHKLGFSIEYERSTTSYVLVIK